MLIWFLVAFGGAAGSLFRYAVGLAGAALLGSAFPWPTIAINVVGSAIIGAVAAATLPGGALPNSPALRALVMVGFCGGFTTFSSFSLQTLDLFCEGRAGAALGNVALSVVLCLAAVAGGFVAANGAASVVGARRADVALRPGSVALVVLEDPATVGRLCDAASALLDAAGGGRLEVLAPRPLRPADEAATEDVAADLGSNGDARHRALAAAYRHWRSGRRPGTAGSNEAATPAAERGDPLATVQAHALAVDLVAIGRSAGRPVDRRLLHAVLFDARRPVLVVPPEAERATPGDHPSRIAVLWNGRTATAKAVGTVAGLTRAGDRRSVILFRDASIPAAAVALAGLPGVPTTGQAIPASGRFVDVAATSDADLLVAGVRRGDLDGGGHVDRAIAEADVPLLLRR